jgi:hypothetical protein
MRFLAVCERPKLTLRRPESSYGELLKEMLLLLRHVYSLNESPITSH